MPEQPPPLAEYRGQIRFEWLVMGVLLGAAIALALVVLGPPRFLHDITRGIDQLWIWTRALPAVAWPSLAGVPAVLATLALLAVLALLAGLASRYHFRHQRIRQTIWYEVRLFQNDVAEPAQIRGIFDQLWDALYPRSRWLGSWAPYRWVVGPAYYTLAVVRDPAVDDQIHLVLGAPAPVMDRVLAAWQTVYQNVRFLPWHAGLRPPRGQYVRWGLHYRTWIRLTDLVSHYEMIPLEVLLQALAREAWRAADTLPAFACTYTFTPQPTRRAWRALEQAARYAEWTQDSPAESAARSALTQVGRGRWYTEWRAATDTYDAMQRIVGAWGLHNRWAQLQPRNVLLLRRFFGRWMAWGAPRVWPFAGGLALWSAEAATFFGWPTGRLRIADLPRSVTRRMPPPRALPRQADLALMQAEGGEQVGIAEADRHKNLLLLGIQGSGKSTTLLNLFRHDVAAVDAQGRPAKAVVLFDIGKDTAQAALRLVPPTRQVLWFAPGDTTNPWLIQPFVSAVDDGQQVDHLLDLLQEVFGADAIGPRSRQILGHVFSTVIAAATPEHPPTFGTAYQMMVDPDVRDRVIAEAAASGRLPAHSADYWAREFPQLLANNPSFWEEAMAAPRNKLDVFLRNESLRGALGAGEVQRVVRRAIDWARVIRERQVVIVNLDEARMSRQAVSLFGITTTLLIWHAIQRQGLLGEADRVPVSLLYDEAQEYLSPQFLSYLALGRAYGFQTALATRFLLEIEDDRLRAGLVNLCQNRIIHRIPEEQDAKALMLQMMTIYINNITLAEEAQTLERFMADDIMRLPDRHAICLWQAGGVVQHPFNAVTIDWRPYAHDAWALHHLAQQAAATRPPAEAPADTPRPAPVPPLGNGAVPTSSGPERAEGPDEAVPPFDDAPAGEPTLASGELGEPPEAQATSYGEAESPLTEKGERAEQIPIATVPPASPRNTERSPEPPVDGLPSVRTADSPVAGDPALDWDAVAREFGVAPALLQRIGRRSLITPEAMAAYVRTHLHERPVFQSQWPAWLDAAWASQGGNPNADESAEDLVPPARSAGSDAGVPI